MNNKLIRVVLIGGFFALAAAFFFPLWEIAIYAPQYPEGLNLIIWLNKITGDLNNVNILNHYIGMKAITPNEIPEFALFPKIVMGLLAMCLFTIILPRLWSLLIYFVSFLSFSLFALYDFWKWEYDYGHNLNPDAPIKVSGMSYQPPLFGKETLLNITVYSYPGIGGWLMSISFLLILYTIWIIYRRNMFGRAFNKAAVLAAFFLLIISCTKKTVEPIQYGSDYCHHCKMQITDKRYGGALLTKGGITYKYDALECLHEDYKDLKSDIESIYIVDFKTSELVDKKNISIYKNEQMHGPMGTHLQGWKNKTNLQEIPFEDVGK